MGINRKKREKRMKEAEMAWYKSFRLGMHVKYNVSISEVRICHTKPEERTVVGHRVEYGWIQEIFPVGDICFGECRVLRGNGRNTRVNLKDLVIL